MITFTGKRKLLNGLLVLAASTAASSTQAAVTMSEGNYATSPSIFNVISDKNSCSLGLGPITVQYNGGNSSMRAAQIVNNPTNSSDKALKMWVKEPNDGDKGRVQLNAYSITNTKKFNYSVDMYLPWAMKAVGDYPGMMGMMTISEWWNEPGWGDGKPFRISLNIAKKNYQTGSPLIFSIRAQRKVNGAWSSYIWSKRNERYEIPFNKWIKLRYYFSEGKGNKGKFTLKVEDKAGNLTTIFSIKNWMYSPIETSPNGLAYINPMKLYVHKNLLSHMKSKGKTTQIYFDNVNFDNVTYCN